MSKRPTIGDDPLAAYLGTPLPEPNPTEPPSRPPVATRPRRSASKRTPPQAPPVAKARNRATFVIADELVNEARSAVLALSGPPLHLTLSALVETALRRELDRLSKAHNHGNPWPAPTRKLIGGRPLTR